MSVNAPVTAAPLLIRSGQGDYEVEFAPGVAALREIAQSIPDAFFLVDARVRELHPALLADFDSERTYALTATEDEKTLAGVERVATFLQSRSASRGSTLVVAGGGITQDVGTFVSHIYYRGIPYVYFPTTLLSMADSCIGAKCGVNLGSFKNQLGFFRSPARVAIAPDFLETLSAEDVRSGFGEILKLAITAGEDDFAWFEERLMKHGFGLAGIAEAINRSLATKQAVIEEDEYERGLRKTLNYGHTFGHALETVTEHEVPHGLAVAWGVDVANYVAAGMGRLDGGLYRRVHRVIAAHFGFTSRRGYDARTLIAAMKRDKKAAAGSVQLILPSAIGKLAIVPTPLDAALQALVADYMREDDIGRAAA